MTKTAPTNDRGIDRPSMKLQKDSGMPTIRPKTTITTGPPAATGFRQAGAVEDLLRDTPEGSLEDLQAMAEVSISRAWRPLLLFEGAWSLPTGTNFRSQTETTIPHEIHVRYPPPSCGGPHFVSMFRGSTMVAAGHKRREVVRIGCTATHIPVLLYRGHTWRERSRHLCIQISVFDVDVAAANAEL